MDKPAKDAHVDDVTSKKDKNHVKKAHFGLQNEPIELI